LGKISFQAVLVLGKAVKKKIQLTVNNQYGFSKGAINLPKEDPLNKLFQLQIDNQDKTVVDIKVVNAIELEGGQQLTTPKRWVMIVPHSSLLYCTVFTPS
jgi:hypothetical protein